MKLSSLLQIAPALSTMSQVKLPAKVGFRVAKAINMIRPTLEAYEQQRQKLLQELGSSEDGQTFTFDAEAGKAFAEQMNALANEEVTLELPTVTVDELGSVDIEVGVLAALSGIIIVE